MEQNDQADLALEAALEMLEEVENGNVIRADRGEPEFYLRIGLHSGPAIVGNIGSALFIDYTAMGETVNVASRIEGVNKYFGTRLCVTDDLAAILTREPPSPLAQMGRVAVVGKAEPTAVFTLASEETIEAHSDLSRFLEELNINPDSAKARLDELIKKWPDFLPARFHETKFETATPKRDEGGDVYWTLESK